MQHEDILSGWVKLYHPMGAQITIPLDLEVAISPDRASNLMQSVSTLINSGFSVYAPGLEDGERYEEIGFVVRKEKENGDQTVTPVVDLYPANGNFRLLAKYLNNDADLAQFEQATGLKLAKLPVWDGDNAIERGKSTKTDKYVTTLQKPVKIVWKFNPNYDADETDPKKKKPRRLFVRWADVVPAPEAPATDKITMTFDAAIHTLTPAGAEIGSLNHELLAKLAESKAPNVTEEMRAAAWIILKTIEKERTQ